MAIVSELNGVLYCPVVRSLSNGYSEETLREIAAILKAWGVTRVVVESNFGDGMWSKLLLPHLLNPVEIVEVRNNTQKEIRILDTLQPVVENHRLVIDPSVAKNEGFGFQFSRISRDRGSLKHDDIIDALSIAVDNLKDRVAVDPTSVAKRKAEREQLKEIKDFLHTYRKNTIGVGREPTKGFMDINRDREKRKGFLSRRW